MRILSWTFKLEEGRKGKERKGKENKGKNKANKIKGINSSRIYI